MPDLLVDTDIFVDHLRGARALRLGRRRIHYSVVTRCELFAGRAAEEEAVRRLLAPFIEVPVDREIAECAGRLRRDHLVRTPDALIAATALARGLHVMTRNLSDFEGIRGLTVRSAG